MASRRRPLASAFFVVAAVTLIVGCSSGTRTYSNSASSASFGSTSLGGASPGSTSASTDSGGAGPEVSGIPAAPAGPLEKTNLLVYAVPTTDAAGLYVAQYDGLFRDEGLNVTIKAATSDETVINVQALDSADVIAGNYVSLMEAQDNYDNGILPSGNNPNPPEDEISSNLDVIAEASIMNPGDAGLFVPADSAITSVAALAGKTVGINAPLNIAYLMISSFLEANGMSPAAVHYAYYPFPDMIGALTKHEVQVAFLTEPYISIAEESYGLSELTNLDEGLTQNFPVEGYAVTKQWASQNPNTLAAFTRALEQGQDLADTDRELAEKALMTEIPGLTARYAAVLTLENYPIGPVAVPHLQRIADDMALYGLLPANFDVKQMIGP
jgi:NitT/TauT family transport system substrate-binding protein